MSWQEVISEAHIPVIYRTPSFADGITLKMIKYLTPTEEEQLKQITTIARSDEVERLLKVKHQVFENRNKTESNVLAFTVCSACGITLRGIKKRIFSRLLSGSITYGLICNNEKCAFYFKLIPTNKVSKFTNTAFIQQLTLATENYLHEHPELRRK
jgi:hypothetical protein